MKWLSKSLAFSLFRPLQIGSASSGKKQNKASQAKRRKYARQGRK